MDIQPVIERVQHAVLLAVFILSNLILLPTNVQMLMYTLPVIYIGSHLSLNQAGSKPEAPMTKKDAMLFPFLGSGVLVSLYFAYKYFGPWLLNLLVSSYVSCIGVVGFGLVFDTYFASIAPNFRNMGVRITVPTPFSKWFEIDELFLNFSALVAASVGGAYFVTKHFVLHNILAVALSIQGIRSVSLGSFKVAFTLLWGLFVYDVFWVFGTDVMVTVAKNFEGPIKLILPVSFDPWKNGILGLGDIVVPGLFIALCLRFDRKSKLIFWASYVAYFFGLLTTGVVLAVFNAAQPALLYLVPAVTGAAFITAWKTGRLTEFFAYDEEQATPKAKDM